MKGLVDLRSWRDEHEVDSTPVASPNAESLKQLVGMLLDAVSPAPSQREPLLEIRIRNFRSARFELVDDLIVVLEEVGDGHYVANSYDTGQYGYGHSPDDALHGLCSTLEEYYDLLLEDEDRLSPELEAHLRYLRVILRERM